MVSGCQVSTFFVVLLSLFFLSFAYDPYDMCERDESLRVCTKIPKERFMEGDVVPFSVEVINGSHYLINMFLELGISDGLSCRPGLPPVFLGDSQAEMTYCDHTGAHYIHNFQSSKGVFTVVLPLVVPYKTNGIYYNVRTNNPYTRFMYEAGPIEVKKWNRPDEKSNPQNLLVNGGFETPRIWEVQGFDSVPWGSIAMYGWERQSGEDKVVRTRSFSNPAEGNQFVTMSPGSSISQILRTTMGEIFGFRVYATSDGVPTMDLEYFCLSENHDFEGPKGYKTFVVEMMSQSVWMAYIYGFKANCPGFIRFQVTARGPDDVFVDDVKVWKVAPLDMAYSFWNSTVKINEQVIFRVKISNPSEDVFNVVFFHKFPEELVCQEGSIIVLEGSHKGEVGRCVRRTNVVEFSTSKLQRRASMLIEYHVKAERFGLTNTLKIPGPVVEYKFDETEVVTEGLESSVEVVE